MTLSSLKLILSFTVMSVSSHFMVPRFLSVTVAYMKWSRTLPDVTGESNNTKQWPEFLKFIISLSSSLVSSSVFWR